MRALTLALFVSLSLSLPHAAAQQPDFTWTEIPAPYTRANNAYFGISTVWDGERLAISSQGRLDVYRFDGASAPVFEQQILATSATTTGFPGTVAIDHGRMLVTDNGDPGYWSIVQFALTGTTWAEAAHLSNPAPTNGDGVFVRMAIDGNRWAVSNPYIGSNRGSIDLVHYAGTGPFTWTLSNRQMMLNPGYGELYGHTIRLIGDELLVSAIAGTAGGSSNAGRVMLYRDTGTGFTQLVSIDNATPAYGDQFGDTTDFDASYIYIGCHGDDTNGNDSGAVYVYDRSGTRRQTILGTTVDGGFGGGALEVDGDYMVTSAPTTFAAPGTGHVFLYRRDASGMFVQRGDVADLAPTPRSYFGFGTQLRGHTMVVSSQAATVGGATNAGRVWWGTFSEPDGQACSVDIDCTHRHCVSGACAASAPVDAGTDAGTDAAVVATDSGIDAGIDAAVIAPDTGVDAGMVAMPDAFVVGDGGGRDAGGDAGSATTDGSASPDATAQADAGAVPRIPLSCTCRAAGASRRSLPLPLSLLALALLGRVLRGRNTHRRV